MKRVVAVILSLVYLAAGSGFTLRQHYCMDKLIGTAIDQPSACSDTHSCAKCGMEKNNDGKGCCKDKIKTLKASPDQLPAKVFSFKAFTDAAILAQSCPASASSAFASLQGTLPAPAHRPPDIATLPIYLQVGALLI